MICVEVARERVTDGLDKRVLAERFVVLVIGGDAQVSEAGTHREFYGCVVGNISVGIVLDMPRHALDDFCNLRVCVGTHPDADACSFDGGDNHKTEWIGKDTVRVAEYFRVEEKPLKVWQGADGSVSEAEIAGAPSRTIKRRVVAWYKLTAKEVIERNVFPSRYIPIVPVYGHIIDVAGKRQITGLIHNAMDAQRMYNYSASAYVERVALIPKAPFVAAEGQIEGHEAEWASANTSNNPVLTYKATDINGTPVPPPQRQPGADIPSGWLQSMQTTEHDIQSALGMYNASLGAPSNEKSGKAIMARQRESDVATFHFIDNLSRAIRQVGRILVDMIPRIYDTQRVVRILGEDGSVETAEINPDQESPMVERRDNAGNVIAKIYNPTLGKYDVSISVGPAYTTKRQEAADFMSQIAQSQPQLMPIIGDLMFRAMDMPFAEEIAERMKKMLPPQLQDQEEQPQQQQGVPPHVQQAVVMAGRQIEQLQGALQQAQQQLEMVTSENQTEQTKLSLDARKIAVDEYKAETERMQVRIEAMQQQAPQEQSGEGHESAALQAIIQRIESIAQAIQQPPQQPVQVFVDGGQKPVIKRSRAVKQDDGSWAMESVEEPIFEHEQANG